MDQSYVTLQVPQINTNDDEVRVVEWRVADGSRVACGDVVVVVETSKATQDVEAPVTGFIRRNAAEGSDAKVGSALAFLAETLAALPGQRPLADLQSVKATAKARELAAAHGVDLNRITKAGIVTEHDVRAAMAQREAAAPPAIAPPAATGVPLSAVQLSVRRAVEQSVHETAPAYLLGTADVTQALAQVQMITERSGMLVTLTDILIYVVARSLREFPRLNARLVGANVQPYDHINVGITVEANDDLYAVIMADADKSTLAEIAEKRAGYAMQLFRGQSLGKEALRGGTFTVTVLSQTAVVHQVPIIFPEQAGIVGLGAVQDALRKGEGGELVARHTAGLSISYDHRFVNGNYAAKFLQALAVALENFRAGD